MTVEHRLSPGLDGNRIDDVNDIEAVRRWMRSSQVANVRGRAATADDGPAEFAEACGERAAESARGARDDNK